MIAAISREPMLRTMTTTTLIHVHQGRQWVGVMFLDEHDRLYRCDPDIPRDVALKVLVSHTRQCETSGVLVGQKDGRCYHWQVAGWDR